MIKGTDRNIPLPELHPFKDHPYKVEDNTEMDALCVSIGKSGLLSPIIVRPRDEGGYEIISQTVDGISVIPSLWYALKRRCPEMIS